MEKLKELQDLAIWMTGCGYDFTQHEHFLKNKHLLTDEAINYTHRCTELRDEYLQPELDKYKNIKIERTKGKSDM